MKCQKCGYIRQPNDDAPNWKCPMCDVVYAKLLAQGLRPSAKLPQLARKSQVSSFRRLRVFFLLLILLVVALDAWLTVLRTSDWQDSLWVVIYPIHADGSAEVAEYIRKLNQNTFQSIEGYMSEEAHRYGVKIKDVVEIRLGPVIAEQPPLPPVEGSVLEIMLWSLKLRYWTLVVDEYDGPRPDIRVFVLYNRWHQGKRLSHSTGLQKGMVSVVHAFAKHTLAQRNNVVITHEMLHTLGATDKYNLTTGLPLFPDGYAEPELQPRYPQKEAELMGAYIPISATESIMPKGLYRTRVGEKTAQEIGWKPL